MFFCVAIKAALAALYKIVLFQLGVAAGVVGWVLAIASTCYDSKRHE